MRSLVSSAVLLAVAARQLGRSAASQAETLRVCADPNNPPFSKTAGQGFENKLAEALAQKLGKSVVYTWWAQRRGFIRHTLNVGVCDLVMGVPAHYDLGRDHAAVLSFRLCRRQSRSCAALSLACI